MAEVTCKLIMRSDTAANWTSNNPVLATGEIGFESDTRTFKWGDGTSTWTLLTYTSSVGGALAVPGGVDNLTTATGVVEIASSAAPSVNDVLRATSGTAATWQAIDYIGIVIATTDELDFIFDSVNTSSAKVTGHQVFNTTSNKPVWSLGSANDSLWVDATGSTAHTPAGSAKIAVSTVALTFTGLVPIVTTV